MLSLALHTKIQHNLLLLVVLTLFFPRFPAINSTAIILLLLNGLLSGGYAPKIKQLQNNYLVIACVLFYLWHVIGLWHSTNWQRGLFDLQVKLPILVLPIFFATKQPISRFFFEYLLRAFVLMLLLVSCFNLLRATWRAFFSPASEAWYHFFIYNELGSGIGLHPTYYAFFVLWAFFIKIYFLYNYIKYYTRISRLFFALSLGLDILLIILLSVRMPLLVLMLGSVITLVWIAYQHQKLWQGIGLSTTLIISLVLLLYFNPITHKRFKDALDWKQAIQLDKSHDHSLGKHWDGRALRLAQWQCAIAVIEQNWLWGVGTGDSFDELQKSYTEHKFYFASQYNSYDTHNQYLETFMGLGIIGIALLLIIMYVHAQAAFSQGYFLYPIFVLCFVAVAFTENVLSKNQSVVFFTFFLSLLHHYRLTNPSPQCQT